MTDENFQNVENVYHPARKLFLNQIKKLKKIKDNCYALQCQNKHFLVEQIWCEGIVEVFEESKLIINDNSGVKAEITRVDSVPMIDWLEQGKYVTVTGNIENSESDMPIISAIKIHPCQIENIAKAKEMWKLEVIDFWEYLISNQTSS